MNPGCELAGVSSAASGGAGRLPAASRVASALRFACAAVPAIALLYAAVPKIVHPDAFALALFRYDLLPDDVINAVAVVLPWLELVAGLALLAVARLRAGAAWIGALLMAAFGAAIALNLARGIEAACGCFSLDPAAPPAGWGHVALNAALAACCAVAAVTSRPNRSM